MKRLTLFTLLICTTTLLIACGHPRYYSSPGDEMYLLADYEDTVLKWVSHDELHHRFISVADLNCIYRSWELRQAYLAAQKNRLKPNDEYLKHAVEKEIQSFSRGHEFYLGLYCYEEEWNKLTGREPVWELTLFSDTASPVKPLLIEKVYLKSEESWLYLNFLSHGREVYRVIFPLEDDSGHEVINTETRRFNLVCTSLLGELKCEWTMKSIPEVLR